MYIGVMPPRPWSAGGIERSGCPYVRPSIAQVKIFFQGRISRIINGRKLIFEPRHEKPVFRISYQVILKLACSATETS